MSEIFITGHRNPDMDAICSAWAYAYLKNIIDPANTYIPVRCGNMNENTREQFSRLGLEPPRFMKDARTHVEAVYRSTTWQMDPHDPLFDLVSLYSEHRPSVVPIIHKGEYRGLLSVDDINSHFLRENSTARPIYTFMVDNFPKVIRGGRFLYRGEQDSFSAPLIVGAIRYEAFCDFVDKIPDAELPVVVVGARDRHIAKAVARGVPAIIITGLRAGSLPDVDFAGYKGTVFTCDTDTAEALRLLRMTQPVGALLTEELPKVQKDVLFEDAKKQLADSEFRGLPVFDGDTWIGFVTRRCFLERPRMQVIMIDHNEADQSLPGIDEAEIVEIIDHHRLGAVRTRTPIFIASEPVGSSCTIVYHLYKRNNVDITPQVAKVLLSGIVSDTVTLKSPTTTDKDRAAVEDLCAIAGVEDLLAFREELFKAGASLSKQDPMKLIESDFKQYTESGVRIGIGQCEVTSLAELDEVYEKLKDALEAVRLHHGLDWALFLITDVIKEGSILISTPQPRFEPLFAYQRMEDGRYLLPGVMSRKKQLLPEILRVLDEAGSSRSF